MLSLAVGSVSFHAPAPVVTRGVNAQMAAKFDWAVVNQWEEAQKQTNELGTSWGDSTEISDEAGLKARRPEPHTAPEANARCKRRGLA